MMSDFSGRFQNMEKKRNVVKRVDSGKSTQAPHCQSSLEVDEMIIRSPTRQASWSVELEELAFSSTCKSPKRV